MKYQKPCFCCGHTIVAYSHHLNKPLVNALSKLVGFYNQCRIPAKLQKDLDLTKNQYNNFQKLQYFGLVGRTPEGWYPTELGIKFIYGEESCFDRVATFGKKILDNNHEAWQTTKFKPNLVMVIDIDVTSWKKREDYKQEKSNQTKLFGYDD